MAKNKKPTSRNPSPKTTGSDSIPSVSEDVQMQPLETLVLSQEPAVQSVVRTADDIGEDVLLVRRVHPNARLPTRSTEGAAGYDLYAAVDGPVPTRGRTLATTGIQVAIPTGHVGLIWPRSGIAVKRGIETGAGVIDEDYRGEVGVLLHNHTDAPFEYKAGERIAQIVIVPVAYLDVVEADALPETARANRGYGSTGV